MMKKKNKKSSILRYLNPKNLNMEVDRFGYHFSFSGYLKYIFAIYGVLLIVCYLYKLQWQYILFIAIVFALFLPSVFLLTYRNMYEEKRFEDATAYMEQLLYSFKRQPKILNALEDTMMLFEDKDGTDSNMHEAIEKAITYIEIGSIRENVYKEAFAHIEKEYGCKRMRKIHEFMIKVEDAGGECVDSLDILLDDRKLWIDRVYEYLRDKKNIKGKITICIGLSFLIVGLAINMLPSSFGIYKEMISQLTTTLIILINILIWYIVQQKMSGSLLTIDSDADFEDIKRQYDFIMHGNLKKEKKKYTLTAIILLLALPVMYYRFGIMASGFYLVLVYLIWQQPQRRYKTFLKHVRKEVEKVFPEWLMSMALQLQTDNVHVSIIKTIPSAPEILKEELEKLVTSIEKDPDSLQPFIDFMHVLNIPDITSAMKILYSMATFGAADIQEQIGSLVQRNTMLMDKSERIRIEDMLSGMGFASMIPMLTGVLKLLVDLILVVFSLLSVMNTF